MHYLSVKGHTLALKNPLEKAADNYFKIEDRIIIADADVEHFKNQVIANIEWLNKNHPRCKPIDAHWWIDTQTKDIHISGVGPIHFSLYKSKN